MITTAIIKYIILSVAAGIVAWRAIDLSRAPYSGRDRVDSSDWRDDADDTTWFDTTAGVDLSRSDIDLFESDTLSGSLHDDYPMGYFNPASGLPMLPDSSIDTGGNPFGTDWSSEPGCSFDDFGTDTGCGSAFNDW